MREICASGTVRGGAGNILTYSALNSISGCASWSWGALAKLGARRKLHLEGCALAGRRLDPDSPTVHLDDLLCNGEPEARAALGLGKGTVDLVELLKDARLLRFRDARPRIHHAHGKAAIHSSCRHPHFASIREFNGVANEVEEHLGEALLVAKANW